MRTFPAAIVVFIVAVHGVGQAQADQHSASTPTQELSYPANVALSEEPPKGMVFRHFPSGMRLYFYDKDSPGKSNCNTGCESAWPPLAVMPNSEDLDDWTIVTRHDGRQQWAYKGRPVYMRYHDDPNQPMGDGMDGSWHVLDYFSR